VRARYFIFRLVDSKSGNPTRIYLTSALTWSTEESDAFRSTLNAIKIRAERVKASHPDLIIERLAIRNAS
jgi:hypothetical protein